MGFYSKGNFIWVEDNYGRGGEGVGIQLGRVRFVKKELGDQIWPKIKT